jgi:sugar phosphate isomerase/epimerase
VTPPLAVQEHLCPGATPAERMAAALAAGFDGLEVKDASRPAALRAALGSEGLVTTACPENDGFLADFDPAGRERAAVRLRAQLDGVAALGGHGVITPAAWGMWTNRLPPFDPPPRSPEEDRAVLLDRLAALARHAEAAGVLLLLEPLNRYEDHMVNSLAQGADLVRVVESPHLRLLADTYHMNIEEDDLCAALHEAAPVLGAVHLSDSNRFQPGAGHVPFGEVLRTLHDTGFAGTLSVESRVRGEPAEALKACGGLLRGLLDATWR